ncbi:MAG: uroporphyrinogen-III C-methyltransferase, partial [Bacilli bacterium]
MCSGHVYLVGAGPGDEKLISVKGLECIKKADVILYDRLVHTNLLHHAKATCSFVYCGKYPKLHTLRQDGINELLVQYAKEGKCVTRLKGGDPSIFGRVGEECEALHNHHIPYEIVPGITSGVAASTYAGITVTHRDVAGSVAFVTAHSARGDGHPDVDWNALAKGIDTLVFYMGI